MLRIQQIFNLSLTPWRTSSLPTTWGAVDSTNTSSASIMISIRRHHWNQSIAQSQPSLSDCLSPSISTQTESKTHNRKVYPAILLNKSTLQDDEIDKKTELYIDYWLLQTVAMKTFRLSSCTRSTCCALKSSFPLKTLQITTIWNIQKTQATHPKTVSLIISSQPCRTLLPPLVIQMHHYFNAVQNLMMTWFVLTCRSDR